MRHLTAAERDELAVQLQLMKQRALDEIRSTAADVEANVQPRDHEVQGHADEAEAERLSDVRFAEMDVDRARLHDIEQAQQRLTEGRYGVCLDCGEDIPRERLMVLPTAIRCAACQAAAESQAARH
jgi:RNA polymerase-binding protein DksA